VYRAFIQTGKLVNVTVTDHYTDTKAGWTQILTGYRWWRTGVFQNQIWFHSIPRGYTIPERLEQIYGPDQIATAFITGKLNQMEMEDGTGTAAIGSPFAIYSNQALYANLPSQLDFLNVGDLSQDRGADVVGPLVLQFLANNIHNRFFGFFHFSDPDHIGHQYGENSIQYENGIETCDYWLGQIVSKLNSLGLSQNTLIYITSDHGFDEGAYAHLNAPYVFLATNDNNVIRDGDEVDIAPTVYYGLGLWNQSFNPTLDGYPLQLSLSATEEQHRQAVLKDTANLPAPSVRITDSGSGIETISFSASDNNLAAVLLLVDNKLKADGQWIWITDGETVTASGSYRIITTEYASGEHSVKIFAFDEHGANNGGLGNDPVYGGYPSINTVYFEVGEQSAPSNVQINPPPSPNTIPHATPTLAFASPTPKPTSTPDSSLSPGTTDSSQRTLSSSDQSIYINLTNIAFLTIVSIIVALTIVVYARNRKRQARATPACLSGRDLRTLFFWFYF
jgi:hypothetical protein